ncbi:hypothetical protein B4U80_12352, partial [Leptotrombidium deliense]
MISSTIPPDVKNNNYVLAVSFVPTACSHIIYTHKWAKEEYCVDSNLIWNIHGLWAEGELNVAIRRAACKTQKDGRPNNQLVTSEDVDEFHERNMVPLSARYKNNIEYWDYVYCTHAYHLIGENNQKRFSNPKQYFRKIKELYEELNLNDKMATAGIERSDTQVRNMSQWEIGVMGKYFNFPWTRTMTLT